MYSNMTEIDAGVGIITLNRPSATMPSTAPNFRCHRSAADTRAGDFQHRQELLRRRRPQLDEARRRLRRGRNLRDSRALAEMLRRLAQCPKPTIARVQGPAYGGGVGLVACCDIAIATFDVQFSLTEVKLGIIPAVISPHVIAAIGERYARRYMLTAERFSAAEAYRIGLLHEMVTDEAALDEAWARSSMPC
jgi:enoyl-CoA hydratase/carnithine racemase